MPSALDSSTTGRWNNEEESTNNGQRNDPSLTLHESALQLSVIIPTRNSSGTLPRLLHSIQTQTYTNIETLIVDNHSNDQTFSISQAFGAKVLSGGPERSAQRNQGAKASKGDLLLFLDADMELSPYVVEDCGRVITKGADAACVHEQSVGAGYWSRARALERSSYFGSEIFEAARCFRRGIFDSLNGYDPSMTGVEDLDIHARLREAGFRLGWVDAPILHHEENVELMEYLRKRRYYGKTDTIYARRHPERWKRQRSLRERWSYIRPNVRTVNDLHLLPGIAILRGLEWFARK